MKEYGVACAFSETFTNKDEACEYIRKKGAPIVVKADGLAAGKGVVVAATVDEALAAVEDMMANGKVGDAGKKLVIEEYLEGVEISVLAAVSVTPEYAVSGNATIVPFLPARDHKRLMDGAKGPNTGGMGAVCPLDDVTPKMMEQFDSDILQPTLNGLIKEKFDYRGFIFFGLMLTKEGPKCLEYNVRLGDPETQAVLPLMDSDFADVCRAITDGTLKDMNIQWKNAFAVAPVAVSGGYPREYKKGYPLIVREDDLKATGAKVFVAGAIVDRRATHPTGNLATLVTSGGRVLACSASARTFQEAWDKAYKAMSCIRFQSMYYRKDIGLPGASEST
jgi:phosphoribosylamine--glycine ligase